MKKALAFATVLFLSASLAFAQRTVSGTSVIDVSGSVPFTERGFGFSATYGKYLLDGFWNTGIRAETMVKISPELQNEYDLLHVFASYERDWRLIASWNRVFNIYGGGGVLLGTEVIDPRNLLKDGEKVATSKASFMYGLCANACAELYLMPYFSVILSVKPYMVGGSRYGSFYAFASAGLRFSF